MKKSFIFCVMLSIFFALLPNGTLYSSGPEGNAGGGEGDDGVWFEKLVSTPIYKHKIDMDMVIPILKEMGIDILEWEIEVEAGGVAGYNLNCEGFALSICDQDKIGFYPVGAELPGSGAYQ